MNTSQALSKLRKLLGPKAGLQDHKKPSSPEQRAEARKIRLTAMKTKEEAERAMIDRRNAILKSDAEFCALEKEYAKAREALRYTSFATYYRYTAGTVGSLFFTVAAEADTLEELIENVQSKNSRAA